MNRYCGIETPREEIREMILKAKGKYLFSRGLGSWRLNREWGVDFGRNGIQIYTYDGVFGYPARTETIPDWVKEQVTTLQRKLKSGDYYMDTKKHKLYLLVLL